MKDYKKKLWGKTDDDRYFCYLCWRSPIGGFNSEKEVQDHLKGWHREEIINMLLSLMKPEEQ